MSNIYVSIKNYFGDIAELANIISKEFKINVTVYKNNMLCFSDLSRSHVSEIMKIYGFSYTYTLNPNAPEMFDIKVKFFQNQNYTPASAMHRWAMQNYETFGYTAYGDAYIVLYHCKYFYDSWEITKLDNGKEEVTIRLIKKEDR